MSDSKIDKTELKAYEEELEKHDECGGKAAGLLFLFCLGSFSGAPCFTSAANYQVDTSDKGV
ncbi:hypothetical protein O9K51_10635 [Purpureocillium lavendulum]|uniref:Uncharacterized protein n=1 Tax=Purpureocillium lavendulum TaxID=1247861 RepID=A0AB34FCX8_9HYPO|nr:hypothetical protein O9K51_10635 [Purpureocillium lavendulum]